jgi:hypothetical protein
MFMFIVHVHGLLGCESEPRQTALAGRFWIFSSFTSLALTSAGTLPPTSLALIFGGEASPAKSFTLHFILALVDEEEERIYC